ncbi:uncharacterized protein A1O9_10847 [Exophiala aquamarina CBS 119918]|uniref:SMP-30/Gluconolactonase/LRE-like region domain-containing protein n=1 Tax=Exophiala aquamarina CBS 119918 TaxID=1182545 RepID=A0A072NZA6_9EURO|nr:uncharacterized protein A1O9_10847 [Exophiala aquamarina CBS 119918]KEF52941.1 hypothetical protein A1O9_10847 [Exophiala aquamarina CBS 119918]
MSTPAADPQILVDGLYFGESPRWRDGKLYISDMTGCRIYTIDESGHKEVLIEVKDQPNGMCFKDDGTLIYSSMFDRQLHQYKDGKSQPYADLSSVMTGYCGDMVIDSKGRIYIDDTGARVLHGEKPGPGRLLLIGTDRSVKTVAENIIFPNGIGINSSGKDLFVAETFGYQLNHFDITDDGALLNRTVQWDVNKLALPPGRERTRFCTIDGLCIDSEDGIWLSMLNFNAFVRRDAQGNITHQIKVDGDATACTLGGVDGKTLFLVVNRGPPEKDLFDAMVERETSCIVYSVRVDIGRGSARP